MISDCPRYKNCLVALGKYSLCSCFCLCADEDTSKRSGKDQETQILWPSPVLQVWARKYFPSFILLFSPLCFCLLISFNPFPPGLSMQGCIKTTFISWFLWIWCKFLCGTTDSQADHILPLYRENYFLKSSRWPSISLLISLLSVCWMGISMVQKNLVQFIKSCCHSQCSSSHPVTKQNWLYCCIGVF